MEDDDDIIILTDDDDHESSLNSPESNTLSVSELSTSIANAAGTNNALTQSLSLKPIEGRIPNEDVSVYLDPTYSDIGACQAAILAGSNETVTEVKLKTWPVAKSACSQTQSAAAVSSNGSDCLLSSSSDLQLDTGILPPPKQGKIAKPASNRSAAKRPASDNSSTPVSKQSKCLLSPTQHLTTPQSKAPFGTSSQAMLQAAEDVNPAPSNASHGVQSTTEPTRAPFGNGPATVSNSTSTSMQVAAGPTPNQSHSIPAFRNADSISKTAGSACSQLQTTTTSHPAPPLLQSSGFETTRRKSTSTPSRTPTSANKSTTSSQSAQHTSPSEPLVRMPSLAASTPSSSQSSQASSLGSQPTTPLLCQPSQRPSALLQPFKECHKLHRYIQTLEQAADPQGKGRQLDDLVLRLLNKKVQAEQFLTELEQLLNSATNGRDEQIKRLKTYVKRFRRAHRAARTQGNEDATW
eukprot:TRINITY_DN10122_c0_g1_i1.p1 TRINITY_DN10122_c0_g1~~TRINITY_DN10122_c0_g1_i1.p1  ORF type:complete len:465 (+),score=70.84 TRINITY_DN10122_c0_g1_i1:56-1450(+)